MSNSIWWTSSFHHRVIGVPSRIFSYEPSQKKQLLTSASTLHQSTSSLLQSLRGVMLFQENNFAWACNQVCSLFNKTNYPLFLCLLLSRFLHFLSHSVDRTKSVWADCTIQAQCRNLQGKQAHTKLAREHSSTQFSSLGHCRHFGIKQWKWSVYADLSLKNQILQVVVVRVVVVYFVFVFVFFPLDYKGDRAVIIHRGWIFGDEKLSPRTWCCIPFVYHLSHCDSWSTDQKTCLLGCTKKRND